MLRNQTNQDLASQYVYVVVSKEPKEKIKLGRTLEKRHKLKEGDIIKVNTPDGCRYAIRLKRRDGDLWFDKESKLVNQVYANKKANY